MSRKPAFAFDSLRDYLAAELPARIEAGDNYRALAQKSGINSPNYLQQVIQGKRRLSDEQAKGVARTLGLKGDEREYFLLLARLARAKKDSDAAEALDDMKKVVARANKQQVSDASIHSHWLHAIVFEMAQLQGEPLTRANVAQRLAAVAPAAEAEASFDFLVAKKWLVPTGSPDRYAQRSVQFAQLNDVRRIELHQVHRRMLELAKHRLADGVDEREMQGLTIAVPLSRLPWIKEKLRRLMHEVNDEFTGVDDADTVVHVFAGAFKVTQ